MAKQLVQDPTTIVADPEFEWGPLGFHLPHCATLAPGILFQLFPVALNLGYSCLFPLSWPWNKVCVIIYTPPK
jgi:hypothetical protein